MKNIIVHQKSNKVTKIIANVVNFSLYLSVYFVHSFLESERRMGGKNVKKKKEKKW